MPQNGKTKKWETPVFEENSFTLGAFFLPNSRGQLEVDWRKEVDWQGLVNGVGGHEVLEW
eukprot:5865846-Amphidinium_carterae.1